MTESLKLHHIALVVENIEESLSFWESLGLSVESVSEVPEQESRVTFLPIGDAEIELVEPTDDTSGIARYLAKRGPGMHHICIEVDDIASILGKLQAQGFRLINNEPQLGPDGRKYAFVHPESTQGVLVELYQLPG
jgi:methylmalonyl-CoA/ethylmalonyl-CoA epimerase